MTIWIDAQLSPALAPWIEESFHVQCRAVRDLGLRDATDREIFYTARQENAIVISKDSDFPHLLHVHGAPPKVIWLTCGNTSNQRLRQILSATLKRALDMLASGEILVEISG